MTSEIAVVFTERDREILRILARTPLSVDQLHRVSETFSRPFSTVAPLRRRMRRLVAAGWVQSYRYATAGPGAVNYYKLTRPGYRLLNGPNATMPTRRFFSPVSLGRQQHTRSLADFLVHTMVGAYRARLKITGFYREGELRLTLDQQAMCPDAAFHIRTPDGRTFYYLVELDNGTEPVYSTAERDSLSRKALFYERYQDAVSKRFRVLFVFTQNGPRTKCFMDRVAAATKNPHRILFNATHLDDYLASNAPLTSPVFLDHHHRRQPLILTNQNSKSTKRIGNKIGNSPRR